MKTLQKIKEHKRVLLLAILVLLLLILLLLFAYRQDEVNRKSKVSSIDLPAIEKMEKENEKREQVEDNKIGIIQGRLMEITENSITVSNFKKIKENSDLKETEESMEVYNIKASTPVAMGIDEKVKSALYELEKGQDITVDYDQKTMDAVHVNINDEQI